MLQNHKYSKHSKVIIRATLAVVLLIAIAFPIFHYKYITPSFEDIILKSAEVDADRVTKYLNYAVFLKHEKEKTLTERFEADVFTMSDKQEEYLNDAIHYFELWKIKIFNASGKVIFSTIEKEVGSVNSKPYFQSVLAQGGIYKTTAYKDVAPGEPLHYFAEIYIPIIENDVFIGALEVYYDLNQRKDDTDALTDNINILLIILSVICIALIITMGIIAERLRHSQIGYQNDLFSLASQDSLTKLFNRESMDFRIEQAIQKHKSTGTNYSLVMFDIDHFKKINDTYGHQAGDDVLVELSKTITNRLREADMIGRYGGEEFIVLLPGTNSIGSRTVAENLRRIVEKTTINTSAGEINITISIGTGSFSDVDSLNAQNLIKKVDAAMYQSKQSGRNRITYIEHTNNKEI